ncbi:MAG: aKG-HExxH-type peptide beta-hydroxylase [Candidatus Polarisedimenticolia bacterium]
MGRNARRAWRVLRRLEDTRAGALPALESVLRARGTRERLGLLTGPGFRAWLAAAEEAASLLHPPDSDEKLFEIAARGSHLARLCPRGRVDARFRERVKKLSVMLNARLALRLVPLLMFRLPEGIRCGPARLDLSADGEEGRLAGEIHVEHPVPACARLRPGERVVLDGGRVTVSSGRPVAWRRRALLPGTGIVLARLVVSTPLGLRPAGHLGDAAPRMTGALELLGRAWPDARRAVEDHTQVIVPLRERNTVSFSMPSRPGVSYINIEGKSLVDLTDDLLHETAHHQLHLLEESGRLVLDDGEPRYVSPWRRSLRPLRGILHATFTFSRRAELFRRLLRMRSTAPLPRAWIREELAFEREALTGSLADLADARARGLLTKRGCALLHEMEEGLR